MLIFFRRVFLALMMLPNLSHWEVVTCTEVLFGSASS